jgi:hypothetical protein
MRKLFLLVATVVATMAFATWASANEAVTVVTEPGGQPCTVATCNTGIVNSGLVELRGHVLGIEVHSLDCNNSYTLSVGANGSGTISNFAFTPGDPDCVNIVACNAPWTFTGEETAANVGELNATVCFDGTSLGRCQGAIAIALTETTTHRYRGAVNDQGIAGGVGRCEVTGAWVQTSPINGFEIVHQ